MMLGTNDAKHDNWGKEGAQWFVHDYVDLARSLSDTKKLKKPTGNLVKDMKDIELFLMVPPPVYEHENFYKIDSDRINKEFPKTIREIAKQLKLKDDHVIDIFKALGGEGLDKRGLFYND